MSSILEALERAKRERENRSKGVFSRGSGDAKQKSAGNEGNPQAVISEVHPGNEAFAPGAGQPYPQGGWQGAPQPASPQRNLYLFLVGVGVFLLLLLVLGAIGLAIYSVYQTQQIQSKSAETQAVATQEASASAPAADQSAANPTADDQTKSQLTALEARLNQLESKSTPTAQDVDQAESKLDQFLEKSREASPSASTVTNQQPKEPRTVRIHMLDFTAFKIEGLMHDGKDSYVMIKGRDRAEGDVIDGHTIIEIDRKTMTMQKDEVTYIIRF
jgi:hypothetical protein